MNIQSKMIAMKINYTTELPEEDSFFALFETTGWNKKGRKSKEELFWAITNSWYLVSAYHKKELVGFGRIISDGYLHAFIVDMIIAPEYQTKGIGKEILKRLVKEALDSEIIDIQLFAAKDKKEFYLKNGFVERPGDAPGMQYKIGQAQNK